MFNRRLDVSEWENPKVKAAGLIEALRSLRISSICLFANIIFGLPFSLLPEELKPFRQFFFFLLFTKVK